MSQDVDGLVPAFADQGKDFQDGSSDRLGMPPTRLLHGNGIDETDPPVLVGGNDPLADAGQGGVQPLPALLEPALQLVADQGGLERGKDASFVEGLEDVAKRLGRPSAADGVLAAGIDQVDDGNVLVGADQAPGLDAVDGPLQADVHEHKVRIQLPDPGEGLLAGKGNSHHLVIEGLHVTRQLVGRRAVQLSDQNTGCRHEIPACEGRLIKSLQVIGNLRAGQAGEVDLHSAAPYIS